MVARPAGGREVVGSNPAAPTIMEDKLKKFLILFVFSLFLIIFVSCQDENLVIEPEVTKDSVKYPFIDREDGKFISIYRNYTNENINIVFAMAKQQEVMPDSQNYDFCPDILNVRKGIVNADWFIVNFNYPIVAESAIPNQNDHPNLISYNLPKGTYIGFTMDSKGCDRDQYGVFDIETNNAMQLPGD